MEVEQNSAICMTQNAFCVMHKDELASSLGNESALLAPGVRGTTLFQANPSKHVNCLAIEIDPQTSTSSEYNAFVLYHVFVLRCENELASFALNGAKLELRSGDQLIIKPGSTFHFTNSSFSIPLKLRLVHRSVAPSATVEHVPLS